VGRRRTRKKGGVYDPKTIATLLEDAYPSREPEEFKAVRAFYGWEKSVPERVVENARPVKFERGVLTIHAKNSVWASELSYLQEQVLRAVQKRVPELRVMKIMVRVGELPPRPPKIREFVPLPPSVPLAKLPEELARELARVGNDELRDRIEKAARVEISRTTARDAARKKRLDAAAAAKKKPT